MKIFYLSIISMLVLFLCGCESDALAMAGRFYYRNTELNKDVSLKSVKFQLNRAKEQYADNMAKLALIYYISGLVCERENNYIEALINYEKALTYYSQFLDANLHIAYMYGYLGKEKEESMVLAAFRLPIQYLFKRGRAYEDIYRDAYGVAPGCRQQVARLPVGRVPESVYHAPAGTGRRLLCRSARPFERPEGWGGYAGERRTRQLFAGHPLCTSP